MMKGAVDNCGSWAVAILLLFNVQKVGADKSSIVPSEFGDHLWTTARCRATCLTAIKNETASNQICAKSAACALCWDMCMRLEDDRKVYSLVCKHSVLCERGCQMACNVMLNPVKRFELRGWRFESLPVIDVRKIEGRLRLSWSAPRAPTTDDVTRLVYAVFWQSRNSDTIEPLFETADLFFESTNAHIVFDFDKVIVVAVSPNGPVALVQDALHSKIYNKLNADPPTDDKLSNALDRNAATMQSLQILLLILTLTLLGVLSFIAIAYFCCLKQRRTLQRSNAIRRKTPTRVQFDSPVIRKISLASRISPFARETHPRNVFSISPMPDTKKNDFFFDASRLLTTRISSPI